MVGVSTFLLFAMRTANHGENTANMIGAMFQGNGMSKANAMHANLMSMIIVYFFMRVL